MKKELFGEYLTKLYLNFGLFTDKADQNLKRKLQFHVKFENLPPNLRPIVGKNKTTFRVILQSSTCIEFPRLD